MSDSNDEDSIQLNTTNQNELILKLAKKREKLNEGKYTKNLKNCGQKKFKLKDGKVLIIFIMKIK